MPVHKLCCVFTASWLNVPESPLAYAQQQQQQQQLLAASKRCVPQYLHSVLHGQSVAGRCGCQLLAALIGYN
jgi:hypothetical protein